MGRTRTERYHSEANCSGTAILRLGRALDNFRRAWAGGYGLGASEMDALLCLADGPAQVGELADCIGLGVEETRRSVERLVFVRAAEINISFVRREALVTLTPRGYEWAHWGTAQLAGALEAQIGPDNEIAPTLLAAAELVEERAGQTRTAVRRRGRGGLES